MLTATGQVATANAGTALSEAFHYRSDGDPSRTVTATLCPIVMWYLSFQVVAPRLLHPEALPTRTVHFDQCYQLPRFASRCKFKRSSMRSVIQTRNITLLTVRQYLSLPAADTEIGETRISPRFTDFAARHFSIMVFARGEHIL